MFVKHRYTTVIINKGIKCFSSPFFLFSLHTQTESQQATGTHTERRWRKLHVQEGSECMTHAFLVFALAQLECVCSLCCIVWLNAFYLTFGFIVLKFETQPILVESVFISLEFVCVCFLCLYMWFMTRLCTGAVVLPWGYGWDWVCFWERDFRMILNGMYYVKCVIFFVYRCLNQGKARTWQEEVRKCLCSSADSVSAVDIEVH